jgi:signal transduction histidine kinase
MGAHLGTLPTFAAARFESGPAGSPLLSVSVNLALGLVLAGASPLAAVRLPALASLLGALCAALGLSAGLGHLFGIAPAYTWPGSTPMAPFAAACLVLLGSSLAIHPAMLSPAVWVRVWQVPVLCGLVTVAVAALLAQSLAAHETEQLDRLASAGARRVRAELRERLGGRMAMVSGLATEWQDRFFAIQGAWEEDVRLLFARSPGLVAVEWLGESGERDWIYPRDVGLPAAFVADPSSRRARLAGPVSLGGGARGLRVLAPLVKDRRVEGWLVGTFRSRELLAEMLSGLEAQWIVRVEAEGVELFGSAEASAAGEGSTQRVALDVPGAALFATVRPTEEMVRSVRSPLPRILFGAGITTALLLALALGLRNLAAARASALRGEVARSQRAHEELRRLYAELEDRVRARTLELSQRNEDLRRFASFVSHELRQPVGTLALWTELLESRLGEAPDAEGRRYLSEIRACVKKLAEQISAQLVAASARPKQEATDLVALIREVVASLKPALDEAEAVVDVEPLPLLRVDPEQMHGVFFNLLENAVKYRRPGVPLEIRVRHLGNDPIEIGVEDNGRGFGSDEAERLFAEGERLAQPGIEGYGLGLPICRRVLERHGGSLHAEGRSGWGASFRLRFPADVLVTEESEAP